MLDWRQATLEIRAHVCKMKESFLRSACVLGLCTLLFAEDNGQLSGECTEPKKNKKMLGLPLQHLTSLFLERKKTGMTVVLLCAPSLPNCRRETTFSREKSCQWRGDWHRTLAMACAHVGTSHGLTCVERVWGSKSESYRLATGPFLSLSIWSIRPFSSTFGMWYPVLVVRPSTSTSNNQSCPSSSQCPVLPTRVIDRWLEAGARIIHHAQVFGSKWFLLHLHFLVPPSVFSPLSPTLCIFTGENQNGKHFQPTNNNALLRRVHHRWSVDPDCRALLQAGTWVSLCARSYHQKL